MKKFGLKTVAATVLMVGLMAGQCMAAGITGKVNVNKATLSQLQKLPGVGVKKAQAIVAYRSQHAIQSADELLNIKGFSKKIVAKVKDSIVFEGETTVVDVKTRTEATPK